MRVSHRASWLDVLLHSNDGLNVNFGTLCIYIVFIMFSNRLNVLSSPGGSVHQNFKTHAPHFQKNSESEVSFDNEIQQSDILCVHLNRSATVQSLVLGSDGSD